MKKILLLSAVTMALLMSLHSCKTGKVIVNREVQTQNDGSMLLGRQTSEQFLKEPYKQWYDEEYNDYQPDEASMKELRKQHLKSYHITVFLGTWCGDSHREFPRLMKILKAADVPDSKLTIIAVNRKKESPNGEEGLYNIQRVPTIIFQKYGKEIGRIIEYPTSGYLEKDMVNILKKDDASVGDLFQKKK
ncbi:thioredoxin family protein [Weeksellaceae bacterium A-14]